jgi:transcriptional regulator with PAS, ATPase and Fis domain
LINAIKENRFRQDLYYRLNILRITIPPLRERSEKDIRSLAVYFLKKSNSYCNLTEDAIKALTIYDWPGNVRELENTIERALHLSDEEQITAEHLGSPITNAQAINCFNSGTLREMEHQLISSVLETTNFNMAETAKRLGISRATLYRKTKTYNIR